MIDIRYEEPGDHEAIRYVNDKAFEGEAEGKIVDALRSSGDFIISLVATFNEDVVGHILFSPVHIEAGESSRVALGLGPMSVLPEYQRQGIGSKLVETGLKECQAMGHPVVVVLGHPWFYPRFGFVPSKPLGIEWEKGVPEEVFMVVELEQGALEGIKGIVKYHEAFE
jgi:putative acetyltransferase